MEELDIVKLKKTFEDIKEGTIGTILIKYSDEDYEVEFFDEEMNTIDVRTVGKEFLEFIKKTQ